MGHFEQAGRPDAGQLQAETVNSSLKMPQNSLEPLKTNLNQSLKAPLLDVVGARWLKLLAKASASSHGPHARLEISLM